MVLNLVWKRLFDWRILLAVIGNCEYALFVWSARFIDIATATVIFEAWPLFFVLLVGTLFRGTGRYRRITRSTLALMVLGVVGLAFVVSGETGGFVRPGYLPSSWLLPGLALALGAMVLGAFPAFAFSWGVGLGGELRDKVGDTGRSLELGCVVVAFLLASIGSSGINLGVGLASSEAVDGHALVSAFIAGMGVNAVAGIAFRKANFISDDLGVNALVYSVPVLSLCWLFLFSQVGVSRLDYLFIGTGVIIAANLLINFGQGARWGLWRRRFR